MTNKEAIDILTNTIQLPATRGNGKSQLCLLIFEALQKAFAALEDADVAERKKGHWVVDEDGNIECSECGYRGVGDNYCEHCGADMRGETDAEIH